MPSFTKPDDIKFEDIINNIPDVNTSGFLKELMDSMNAYIKAEFTANRITGNDYANVYLGSMSDALTAVLKYTLEEKLVNLKLETEMKQQALLDAQIAKITFEIARGNALMQKELDLADEKITTEKEQQLVLKAQKVVYNTQAAAFYAKHLVAIADLYVKTHIVDMTQTPGKSAFYLRQAEAADADWNPPTSVTDPNERDARTEQYQKEQILAALTAAKGAFAAPILVTETVPKVP